MINYLSVILDKNSHVQLLSLHGNVVAFLYSYIHKKSEFPLNDMLKTNRKGAEVLPEYVIHTIINPTI